MQAGALVPDEMVNRLVEERIDAAGCAQGFILDGYPRTLAAGGALLPSWLEERGFGEVVIHLASGLQCNYCPFDRPAAVSSLRNPV